MRTAERSSGDLVLTLTRSRRILAFVAAIAAAGCTASSGSHAHMPAVPTQPTTVADFRQVALPSVRVPDGFHVETALRFAQFRTDLLSLRGNSLFWLDARTYANATGTYHRIERLNLSTLEITTGVEGPNPMMGFVTWAHGLVVAEYLPTQRPGCAPPCVRPAVDVIDLRRQPAAAQVIARADPQPFSSATTGAALLPWQHGAIFQFERQGRYLLQAWRWRTGTVTTVRSDRVDSVDFSVVGNVVVGQHAGSRGLWAASLTGQPTPPLPPAAKARGLLGATQGSRLIWEEQPHGTLDHVYASTLREWSVRTAGGVVRQWGVRLYNP